MNKRIGTQFIIRTAPTITFTIIDYNSAVERYKVKCGSTINHMPVTVYENSIKDGTIITIPGKVDISKYVSKKITNIDSEPTNYFNLDDL